MEWRLFSHWQTMILCRKYDFFFSWLVSWLNPASSLHCHALSSNGCHEVKWCRIRENKHPSGTLIKDTTVAFPFHLPRTSSRTHHSDGCKAKKCYWRNNKQKDFFWAANMEGTLLLRYSSCPELLGGVHDAPCGFKSSGNLISTVWMVLYRWNIIFINLVESRFS